MTNPADGRCAFVPLIADWIRRAADRGASDLHLVAGQPPRLRIDGELAVAADEPLDPERLAASCLALLEPRQREAFERTGAADFAAEGWGAGRVRFNLFRHRAGVAVCIRLIPARVPALVDLALPSAVAGWVDLQHGLVLVTGPTGSGKSTTLAALVRALLEQRAAHVLTIEDPIEAVHSSQRGLINQRELGRDAVSFAEALRQALRQDPDAILVGEMRDPETIRAALTLAETGHLVMSTLHSRTAAQAPRRIIDSFPVSEHAAIRAQLAEVLQGVLAQTLLPRVDGGRVLACELMLATAAVRSLIRDDKMHQLQSQIESGQARSGMRSLMQSIASLRREGAISATTAEREGLPPGATEGSR